MGSDHYIDSLIVDLKLQSALSPLKAKDEADTIVDGHVVPAVESVVEEMGADLDASIPQLEIDVGHVRLQDLREAVESALREALDKYRVSKAGRSSTSFSVESLRRYMDTGTAPWISGDVPFNPSIIVTGVLESDPEAVFSSVESFSEKELASLMMAIAEIAIPGSLPYGREDNRFLVHAPDAETLSLVLRLRDSILARLIREFPKTASVLTARLDLWRAYRALGGYAYGGSRKSGGHAAMLEVESGLEEVIQDVGDVALYDKNKENEYEEHEKEYGKEHEEEHDEEQDLMRIASQSLFFQYVEIDQKDVPEGYPLEVMDYKESPDADDPEYIESRGIPPKYYRKVKVSSLNQKIFDESVGTGSQTVAQGESVVAAKIKADQIETPQLQDKTGNVEPLSLATDHPSSASLEKEDTLSVSGGHSYRYVEIGLDDIPEGIALVSMDFRENPGKDDPEYIMSVGMPLKYYRKVSVGSAEEQAARALAETGTDEVVREARVADTEADRQDSEPSGTIRNQADALELTSTSDFGSDAFSSVGSEGAEPHHDATVLTYRYVEIGLKDVPEEGLAVEMMDYLDSPGEDEPEYIMSFGPPLRYYRKVVVGTIEELIGARKEKAVITESKAGTQREAAETGDEITVNENQKDGSEENILESVVEDTGENVGLSSYRYVRIDQSVIPKGVSVVKMEYKETPGENDPEYIVVSGFPGGYFRKIAMGTEMIMDMLGYREGTGHQRSEAGLDNPNTSEFSEVPETLVTPEVPERSGPSDVRNTSQTLDIQDAQEVWDVQAFESEVAEDRYPVSDAGLVLLHPFLGRMMENLGLVKEGEFVSPLARIRAVHLLRDLTMSEEPHYNHNLILEKILCGLPVGYAVPPEWKPTEKEKEEMDALLQAVCEYWKPLSGSSTEALCGTFLRRPGAIERFEDSWNIRVEGHTIDILLDDLPWELSIIYLPWLEKPLAVEWQRE